MSHHKNPVSLTHSELNTLWSCAWKHRLKYELQLEPAGGELRTGALNVGTLVHLGIAEAYRCIQGAQVIGRPPQHQQIRNAVSVAMRAAREARGSETDLFVGSEADALRDEHSQDEETALRCLDLFLEHIAIPNTERYAVLGVEVPFRVPVLSQAGKRSGDWLEGVIDLVLFDLALQKVVAGEHKSTVGDASTYELKLSTDPQLPLYIYALRHMFGPELVGGGVVLNVIRKSYPSEPKVNKDGSVSIAEVDTTRDVYARAIASQAPPLWMMKAVDALAAAKANGDPKKVAKAQAAKEAADERLAELHAKQAARRDGLPSIARFVSQFEETIPDAAVHRAAQGAWNGARLVRLFRRGQLVPWRAGAACRQFNRLCEYHDACVEDVVEPGDLLVKRDARHREVDEARHGPQPDLVAMLEHFTRQTSMESGLDA